MVTPPAHVSPAPAAKCLSTPPRSVPSAVIRFLPPLNTSKADRIQQYLFLWCIIPSCLLYAPRKKVDGHSPRHRALTLSCKEVGAEPRQFSRPVLLVVRKLLRTMGCCTVNLSFCVCGREGESRYVLAFSLSPPPNQAHHSSGQTVSVEFLRRSLQAVTYSSNTL